MSTSRITTSTVRNAGHRAIVLAPVMLEGTPCHFGQAERLDAAVCAVAALPEPAAFVAKDKRGRR